MKDQTFKFRAHYCDVNWPAFPNFARGHSLELTVVSEGLLHTRIIYAAQTSARHVDTHLSILARAMRLMAGMAGACPELKTPFGASGRWVVLSMAI